MNIQQTVRAVVGRRWRITSAEMGTILAALAADGLDLCNPYVPDCSPAGWGRCVHDINCVSVMAVDQIGDGNVRYDQPGSMHPLQHADLTFVSADLRRQSIAYMRQHADRVLVVTAEAGTV